MSRLLHLHTKSDGGPWHNVLIGENEHVLPAYGPRHNLSAHCWCHPTIEMCELGEIYHHNCAQ